MNLPVILPYVVTAFLPILAIYKENIRQQYTPRVILFAKMPLASLTILRRLEAATSRLEDMVPTMNDASASANGLPALPEAGLSTVRGLNQPAGAAASPQPLFEPLPPAIDDFDALINGDVKTYVNMSEEIGGLVAEQVYHRKISELEEP